MLSKWQKVDDCNHSSDGSSMVIAELWQTGEGIGVQNPSSLSSNHDA
jgi:hypothetical protein